MKCGCDSEPLGDLPKEFESSGGAGFWGLGWASLICPISAAIGLTSGMREIGARISAVILLTLLFIGLNFAVFFVGCLYQLKI